MAKFESRGLGRKCIFGVRSVIIPVVNWLSIHRHKKNASEYSPDSEENAGLMVMDLVESGFLAIELL